MGKDLQTIRNEYTKYIKTNEQEISAWENVKIVTKKDGTPFANLGKNFTGAEVVPERYSLHGDAKILRVTKATAGFEGAWFEDEIKFTQLVKYCKTITPSADRIINEPILEPYFTVTIEEMQVLIAEHIETLKAINKRYQTLLDNIGRFAELIDNAMNEIKTELNNTGLDADTKRTIGYAIGDLVESYKYSF